MSTLDNVKIALACEVRKSEVRNSDHLYGNKPTHEQILAWVEGVAAEDSIEWIKHWVASDPDCYNVMLESLEDVEHAALPQPAVPSNSGVADADPSKHDQLTNSTSNVVSLDAPKKNTKSRPFSLLPLKPVFAVAASLAIALLVARPFLSTDTLDYNRLLTSQSMSNAGWKIPIDSPISTRSPGDIPAASQQQAAFEFGVRHALDELGLDNEPVLRNFYQSLSTEYPVCIAAASISDSKACEQRHRWHFDLGLLSVHADRTCAATVQGKAISSDYKQDLSARFDRLTQAAAEQGWSTEKSLLQKSAATPFDACEFASRIWAAE